jgi:hypothetical protein
MIRAERRPVAISGIPASLPRNLWIPCCRSTRNSGQSHLRWSFGNSVPAVAIHRSYDHAKSPFSKVPRAPLFAKDICSGSLPLAGFEVITYGRF